MCSIEMLECNFLSIAVLFIGLVAIIGFFVTKTKGYGKFSISTLLILIVIVIASLLAIANKIEQEALANLFFSVIGFAGGLFAGKTEIDKNIKSD